jgi:hypothetical protein
MHYGSGARFGSGSNITWNKKKLKIKNERTTFWANNAASDIEKARFVTNFFCRKRLNIVWKPEPKLFQSRNRNRNRNKSLGSASLQTARNNWKSLGKVEGG